MPAPKRRKGGIQQRRAADREETTGQSALHELLMTYLAQGILSASMCWNISRAAAEDVKRAGDGIFVSGFGAFGKLHISEERAEGHRWGC